MAYVTMMIAPATPVLRRQAVSTARSTAVRCMPFQSAKRCECRAEVLPDT